MKASKFKYSIKLNKIYATENEQEPLQGSYNYD